MMKRLLAATCLLGGGACTTRDVPIEPACLPEGRQQFPDEEGTATPVAWLGVVRMTETRDKQANTTRGTVGASFYDVSNFSVEDRTPLSLGDNCEGITGIPAQMGTRTSLAVERVDITGLAVGNQTLSNADGGPLSVQPQSAIFGGSVDVNILGTDGGFVNMDFDPLAPPASVDVSAPDLSGSFAVGNAEEVLFRWNAGPGDGLIAIELNVGAGNPDPNLRATARCVVRDDGCFGVPSAVLTWLTFGRSEPIDVTVRRNVGASRVTDSGVDGGAGGIVSLTTEVRGRMLP